MRALCVILFVAGLFGLCVGCQQPSSTKTPVTTKSATKASNPSGETFAGTLSCSGRGCHGDPDRNDKNQRFPSSCSYSLWSDNDPHIKAYAVLSGELGQHMAEKLKTNVTTDKRCLACHVTPQSAELPVIEGRNPDEWTFGVGCESCHGSAQKWLRAHYQDKWTTRTWEAIEKKDQDALTKLAAEQKKLGYNQLSDLTVRARVCAGCHIGAPAEGSKIPVRDMNHDFIAAGHPRLMFEFNSYLVNEPPHWREKPHNAGADLNARAWAIGQVVAAESSLRLLADRARQQTKPDVTRPWPEFAEYDCYACHHTIERDSWRVQRGYEKATPGRFRLSRWYTGLLDVVAPDQVKGIAELEAMMRERLPDAAKVQAKALELANELAKLSPKAPTASVLAGRGQGLGASDWDEAEQIALGLLALYRSAGDKDSELKTREILKLLGFPVGSDNPEDFRLLRREGKEIKSPFDEQLKKLFGDLKR